MKYFLKKIIPTVSSCKRIESEIFSYNEEWSDKYSEELDQVKPDNLEKDDKSITQDTSKKTDVMKADYAITMTGQIVVTAGTVARVVAEWTGLPLTNFSQDDKDRFRGLGPELSGSIIGQPRAIKVIAKSLLRYAAGMRNPDRPIGSFLLIGPTGVGKTALTKKMAEYLFGSQKSLIRIDMSEYMEKHSVSRLIGAPPGYVGYDEGGQLTEAIRRRPYAVILFDEIEKAHPDVFNIMLQILDDGRVTDAQGHTVDFKNAIIILTSNVGSTFILDVAGDDSRHEEMRSRVMDALRSSFRPEFLNRIDEVIIFHSLQRDQLREIVRIQSDRLAQRLADKKMALQLSTEAMDFLAEVGYDPVYGARPLKRAIQRELETPIAKAILRGEFQSGNTIVVGVENERLVLKSINQ